MNILNQNELKLVAGGADASNSDKAQDIALRVKAIEIIIIGANEALTHDVTTRNPYFLKSIAVITVKQIIDFPIYYYTSKWILDAANPVVEN